MLLDRWYTECTDGYGRTVPAKEMDWVDEDYHCFSVCGSIDGDEYMENRPHPTADKGWDHSERNPVVAVPFKKTYSWAELLVQERQRKGKGKGKGKSKLHKLMETTGRPC